MPALVKTIAKLFYQPAADNDSDKTLFGLPGKNHSQAYCYVRLTFQLGADVDGAIWVRIPPDLENPCLPDPDDPERPVTNHSEIWQYNLIDNDYPVALYCCRHDFSFEDDADPDTTDAVAIATARISVSSGKFSWNFEFGTDWVQCGNINNMDRGVWVGGTGTYTVTDPTHPTPVFIGFDDWDELVEYYPWAIYGSGAWQSANRSGGNQRICESGSWRDVKNTQGDASSSDKGHYYTGGSWTKCPKIGNE